MLDGTYTEEPIRLTPSTEEQFQFRDRMYVTFENLWQVTLMNSLAVEAKARRRFAVFPKAGPKTPIVKTRIPRHRTPAASGEYLSRLHSSLLPLVRALTGKVLVPAFCAYGYYDEDDRVLLHCDQEKCAITLLIAPSGGIGPLHLHPNLIGYSMEQLGELESNPNWDRNSGIQLTYPTRGGLAFRGSVIPHHRPGSMVDSPRTVAALCYIDAFAISKGIF